MVGKSPNIGRIWQSGTALFAIGLVLAVVYWRTGLVVLFWLSLIGIIGGIVTWRRGFPSAGNTEVEHESFRHSHF